MKYFFTSDTHFSHNSILEFCPKTRKGGSAEEMNEHLICNWNEQVEKSDTVYHLGDLGWAKDDEMVDILKRLNGNIFLITGNHDKNINTKVKSRFALVTSYLSTRINGTDVIMFHYPILEWDKMHYGAFHLFGHVHGKNMNHPGRCMDVGIDARPLGDMKLWTWEEIEENLSKKPILRHH